MKKHTSNRQVIVIGAGPAGLTAAYELTKHDLHPIVLEKQEIVGGISRTENHKGYCFDMGGHRFFTKVEEARKMWHEVLGHDLLRRPRLSRIYYNRRLFYYPLRPLNALIGLGLWESILIVLSYLRWHLFPYRHEDTFEQWMTNRFGKRLFQIFFKTYTEKVWGIPCSELRAEWAVQRIKNLSLRTALLSMFLKPKETVDTLIHEFDYPRLGPGMLWTTVKEQVERRGGAVWTQHEVLRLCRRGNRIHSVVVSCNGRQHIIEGVQFISSMPITEFIEKLHPPPPPVVLKAARNLHHRDFLTVCLIVDRRDVFPDNWIYIHAPEVRAGRIQNFKNWSPGMVPDPTKTSLGLEYFCTEGDELWNTPDADLIELGKREVERLGLASCADIEDGCVFRVPKAYPVYDSEYRDHLGIVREFVEGLENFQTVGRNGLHRYNNQDHAMLTGMLAVRNLALGEQHDLWSINTDQLYHEEIDSRVTEGQAREIAEAIKEALSQMLSRLDPVAFGLALGVATGMLLFLATLVLVLKGGDVVGPRLGLLGHYFPGYSVTLRGSVLGLAYGFLTGYIIGFGIAFFRNFMTFLYAAMLYRRTEYRLLPRLLDYL